MTNIFEFRRNFSKGSGLYGNGDLFVFQRPAVLRTWNFLEQILENGGAIQRAPGVGKSITALRLPRFSIKTSGPSHGSTYDTRITTLLGKKFNGSIELSELEDAL